MELVGFLVAAFVVLNLIIKLAGKKSKEQAGSQSAAPAKKTPAAQQMRMPMEERGGVSPRIQPTVQPRVQPHSMPPMEHCTHGTVSAGRPASVPEGMSIEMRSPRLMKTDLGAQRQRENPNPAITEKWTPPRDELYDRIPARNRASIGQAQLRRAMILKEVLDRPVSRRKGIRT